MPSGLFVGAYRRVRLNSSQADPSWCVPAIYEYLALVESQGGTISAPVEVLGDRCLALVRNVDSATLSTIEADPLILRIPATILDTPLSDFTPAQRQRIREELEGGWRSATQADVDADNSLVLNCSQVWDPAGGYPVSEIVADLGVDLSSRTLREVLTFLAKRKLRRRFTGPPVPDRRLREPTEGSSVCDGVSEPTEGIDSLED